MDRRCQTGRSSALAEDLKNVLEDDGHPVVPQMSDGSYILGDGADLRLSSS